MRRRREGSWGSEGSERLRGRGRLIREWVGKVLNEKGRNLGRHGHEVIVCDEGEASRGDLRAGIRRTRGRGNQEGTGRGESRWNRERRSGVGVFTGGGAGGILKMEEDGKSGKSGGI